MIKPKLLTGQFIRLEAVSNKHLEGLKEAIKDGELWKSNVVSLPAPDLMDEFVKRAERVFENSTELVYAIVDSASEAIVGATAYTQACFFDKRIEIGPTFIGKKWQGSKANKESKFLLLQHAFETWEMNRVELLADVLNKRSRFAILSLGAKEEGILRSHMVMPDGRVRDTVVYSITRNEWPDIKRHLQSLLYP